MCWHSTVLPIKKIAKEDIPVYKIVYVSIDGKVIASFYQGKGYELNKTYRIKRLKFKENKGDLMFFNYYTIDEGFHSYSYVNEFPDEFFKAECYKALYPALNKHIKIMKCVIPKGSIYYINADLAVVSDTIKPIQIINADKHAG